MINNDLKGIKTIRTEVVATFPPDWEIKDFDRLEALLRADNHTIICKVENGFKICDRLEEVSTPSLSTQTN